MVSLRSPTASWHRRSWLMANPKRASMREGPLAALFRKTEESEEPPREADAPAQRARSKAAAKEPGPRPREGALPHPGLEASSPGVEEEVHVPTPRERLRHAFSSEIPE